MIEQTLFQYLPVSRLYGEKIVMLMPLLYVQYPLEDKPPQMQTALTSRQEEMSRIRARNALKILLDVHGDFGRRATNFSPPLVRPLASTLA